MAGYEQHRQPIEIPGHPGLDLRTLAPNEILALWRMLRDVAMNIEDPEDSPPEAQRRYELHGGLTEALDSLPQQDLEFGRSLYTAFATSSNDDDRAYIAHTMGHLTRVDHDYGWSLLEPLTRDPDNWVRFNAIAWLQGYHKAVSAQNFDAADRALAETGLTATEVYIGLYNVEAADRGENIHSLGEVALQKLIAPSVPE